VREANGEVPFFFMDAYEAPERADVLYLFGKVAAASGSASGGNASASGSANSNASSPGPRGGSGGGGSGSSWQSCCVVVPNLHRSLLVVPRPEVFDDASGEIAALEAAVAQDPARRMELLQVRAGGAAVCRVVAPCRGRAWLRARQRAGLCVCVFVCVVVLLLLVRM
jgi:hypothetical protein